MDGSKARLVAALEVRRNALWGFSISTGLTVGVLAFFVLVPGSVHPTPYYLALAFVLAMSLGALLTAVLVARTAVRVNEEVSDPVSSDPGATGDGARATDGESGQSGPR